MGFQKNKSIADAVGLLVTLAASPVPLGCAEISRRLGCDSTRTNRFLKTLQEEGFVVQDERRLYHTGPALNVLSQLSTQNSRLLRCAMPVFQTFGICDYYIAMGVLHLDRVSFLYHTAPGMTLADGVFRAGVMSATRSIVGITLLAQLTDSQVEALYPPDAALDGYVTTRAELFDLLWETRRQGYAVNWAHEDHALYSFGVPVGSPVQGAIAFAGIRADQREAKLAELRDAAQSITESMRTEKTHDLTPRLPFTITHATPTHVGTLV